MQCVAHGILDEARLKVGVLDDEQLVGALEQLVDGGAHRLLDDLDQVLGVDRPVRADVQRAAAALVVRRERYELEDAVDVRLVETGLEEALAGLAADEALCAGAGVDPGRLDADDAPARRVRDAAAMPISYTISWVAHAVTGVSRWIGYRRSPRRRR